MVGKGVGKRSSVTTVAGERRLWWRGGTVVDKGIAIKAHYLRTPRARWIGLRVDVVEIQDDIVYKHFNLY
jgi:hypothetical protein